MALLQLVSPTDLQRQLATEVKRRRRERKLSRNEFSELTTVPPATIKRFESTGQISLRQFLLLWQCVDRLDRLSSVIEAPEPTPRSIEDVLAS